MWFNTEDISRVGKSFEEIHILNNSTTVIATIGNHGEPGEILEDLKLAHHASWLDMEQYEKEGSRELLLKWVLG